MDIKKTEHMDLDLWQVRPPEFSQCSCQSKLWPSTITWSLPVAVGTEAGYTIRGEKKIRPELYS